MTRPHPRRRPIDWPLWRAYLICVGSWLALIVAAWLIYLADNATL